MHTLEPNSKLVIVLRCVGLCRERPQRANDREQGQSTRIMIRVRLGCGLTGTWAKVLTVTKINCCKVRERCSHPTFDFSTLLDCQFLIRKKHVETCGPDSSLSLLVQLFDATRQQILKVPQPHCSTAQGRKRRRQVCHLPVPSVTGWLTDN